MAKEENTEKQVQVDCPVCGGKGTRYYNDEDVTCNNCNGKGKVAQ